MNRKAALLLILLIFAFTPMITNLATAVNMPTIIAVSLANTTAYDTIFEIQPTGDPIEGPFPPSCH